MTGLVARIGFRAIAGSVAGSALNGVKGVAKWIGGLDLVHALLLLVCITLAVDHVALVMAHRHSAKIEKQLGSCTAARADDARRYAAAQAQAAAGNKAHVDAENRLREQVNEASRNSFVSSRDRLRAQSGADQGSSGAAGVPEVPHAAPGTPPEVVSLPPTELLRAQEDELQLNALIDWVLKQQSLEAKP